MLREAHLRWFSHVLRARGDQVCGIGYDLNVPGERPKTKTTITRQPARRAQADLDPSRPGARQDNVASNNQQSGPRYKTEGTLREFPNIF
ncbi:hypothetical protein Y032_0455g1756 [Ancylostoma ceylanicum]|uniref:Uncharacterized protein n=1 Tax=Ancylostoma ceylanicum TaxID=53326 RepID=A0A016WYH0_9BILA|nr:hypothetical protein Y032_0455g1756 [Ancylostoma ceylanicum]